MTIQTPEELQKEIDTLKTANNAKTELISISSHQLRTSLSAVKWVLKMLEDGDFGPINEEQKNMVIKARESNERMVTLVNDVLNLNHLDSPEASYKFEPTQIADMIQEVVYEFSSEAKKKGISMSFTRPEGEPALVKLDPEKIRVVLQNLVENGLKYSQSGGTVTVAIQEQGGQMLVSVKDAGIGIPDDGAIHIFEKFYRARNAQEKETVGSGLGLYTSKHIVEKHSGKLWFEKNPEGGTIFYFSLPIA